MNSLWKHFKICMCSSYDNWEIIWQYDTLFLVSTSIRSQFQWNRKYFSAAFLDYMWLMVDISVTWFSFAFACPAIPLFTSVSAPISTKAMLQEFHGFWAKSFVDAARYCWYHNDSINLIKNTGEGNWFSVFLMMLPKHVHIDQNLQRRLKSSISFILKYIFICFLYFVKVA